LWDGQNDDGTWPAFSATSRHDTAQQRNSHSAASADKFDSTRQQARSWQEQDQGGTRNTPSLL
jgi:hypothetical protein